MDVELLSKMVKELVLDNDKVSLPGLGAFVAEVVPSTFSDRGYTINPPYRKLSFRAGAEPDTLLRDFYASNNDVAPEMALRILETFAGDLKSALETSRVVNLPGLGRLRSGRDGSIFFVPEEDLDIYPAGFGLEPVSLKSHSKPSSFDFSTLDVPESEQQAAVEQHAAAEPEQQSAAESQPAEENPAAEPAEQSVPEQAAEAPNDQAAVEGQVHDDGQSDPQETEDPQETDAPQPAAEPEAGSVEDERARSEAEYFGEQEEEDDEDVVRRTSAWKKAAIAFLVLVLVAAILVGAFFVMADFFPDVLDRLLYTEEELEILRYVK